MAYRSSTTAGDATSTTLTFAIPAGATTDDILVFRFYGETTLGLTLSFDTGSWTKITAASGQQLGETIDFEVYTYYARWNTASGNIVASWGGASLYNVGLCACHSGRFATGDPQDVTATFNAAGAASATATALGLTTGHTNADLLMLEGNVIGSAHASWTAGLTERVDFAGQGYAEGVQAAAGASGNKTCTVGSCFWTGALVALREAGAAATDTQEWMTRVSPRRTIFDQRNISY